MRKIQKELKHPHLGATYKVVRMKDKSYGVSRGNPGRRPSATITGLATKEDAEHWIERHKNEIGQRSAAAFNISRASESLGISSNKLNQPWANASALLMPPSSPNTQKSPVVVLVVEDEEVIRTLATEFMAEAGFDILEARDANTAVHLLQTEAQRVHVLFTDVQMPEQPDGSDSGPRPPQLALDRLGNNLGFRRRRIRTTAGRYPVLPKAL